MSKKIKNKKINKVHSNWSPAALDGLQVTLVSQVRIRTGTRSGAPVVREGSKVRLVFDGL